MRIFLTAVLAISSFPLTAQQTVSPRNTYERIWAIVPIVGGGNGAADPKRPMFAPKPGDPIDLKVGIIAYSFQPSDDGKFALVEFVARDRAAFKDILADGSIKSFIKGKHDRAEVESEFKRHKKDFDFDHFGTVVR